MDITDILLEKGIFPGSNIRVTHAAQNEPRSECSISVDPHNPNRLVGASKRFYDPANYLFSIGPVFSNDGGLTWYDAPALGRPPDHEIYTDPSTVFDPSGAVWIMGDPGFLTADHQDLFESMQCLFNGQSPDDDIMTTHMLAYKSNDGHNWTQSVPVVPVRCMGDDKGWIICDNAIRHPSIGVHPRLGFSRFHGRMYAIWGASTPLRFARSSDGGQTWTGVGHQKAGTSIANWAYAPDISIGRDGMIHVFWHIRGSHTIQYLRSTDGGESFHSRSGPQPDVVTGLTDLDSGIPAADFKNGWPVFKPSTFRVLTMVSSCCFGESGVAVAWADARPDAQGKNTSRVYYRVSYDNGEHWQGPESGTIMLPLFGGDSQHFQPQLAATDSGALGCAMYSWGANAVGSNKPGIAVLVAASFDQGVNWGFTHVTDEPWDPAINAPPAHAGSSATFIGEYFGFDAGANDFHVLWTDTRYGNQDLFYCNVATLRSRKLPDLVGELVGSGAASDGGGYIIINGHIIRIPPWDPMREVLDVAIALDSLSQVSRVDISRARAAMYDVILEIVQQARNRL
jgi:hypothetical protein